MTKLPASHTLFALTASLTLQGFSPAIAAESDTLETIAARQHLDVTLNTEQEVELALSGAPAHLREGARVYVYQSDKGYKLYKEGSNGFTCLLNRDAFFYDRKAFKPTCWDKAGKNSYVPVMLAVGTWLAQGLSKVEMEAMIEHGFETGAFKSPQTTGIAYMVSGDIDLDPKTGEILKTIFPGHYMFYAPNVTNEQLGSSIEQRKADPSLPRVFSGGAGGQRLAYLITMVGHVHSD